MPSGPLWRERCSISVSRNRRRSGQFCVRSWVRNSSNTATIRPQTRWVQSTVAGRQRPLRLARKVHHRHHQGRDPNKKHAPRPWPLTECSCVKCCPLPVASCKLSCEIMTHSTYTRVRTIGFRIFLDFGLSGEVCLWHPIPFTRLILFLGVGLLRPPLRQAPLWQSCPIQWAEWLTPPGAIDSKWVSWGVAAVGAVPPCRRCMPIQGWCSGHWPIRLPIG